MIVWAGLCVKSFSQDLPKLVNVFIPNLFSNLGINNAPFTLIAGSDMQQI
jgi:hypothetical protein